MPDIPCSVSVLPLKEGGVYVILRVPTYEGEAVFTMSAERGSDSDWRVFLPWTKDLEDQSHILSNGTECTNGIVYLGAPDCE